MIGLEPIPLEELGPPARRRHRAHLGLLPRRVPAPGRAARRRGRRWSPASTSRSSRTSSASTCWPTSTALAGDWRRATARIFGGRPGTYGTGHAAARRRAQLARRRRPGRGLRGLGRARVRPRARRRRGAVSAMRRQFARIDVAVKNVDTREHDLLDSSDYFAEHGGMIAYVRHLAGADPRAVIGDSSDPSQPAARSLAEEARRVFRSRVANPRWIGSMMRHGYKGAFELSATVDYLFGYDATTGVVEDWMYESVTRALRRLRRRARLPARARTRGRCGRSPSACSRPPTAGCGRRRSRRVAGAAARRLSRGRGRARGGRHVTAFPFSALVGQDDLREALLACAVDPAIGGVLVRGERGTAKTTAVRGLAPLVGPARRAADRRDRRPRARHARPRPRAGRGRERVQAGAAGGRRTAACCTSTRSTCCPTISSTCCSTPPRWGACTSSATGSRPPTTRASCSSGR